MKKLFLITIFTFDLFLSGNVFALGQYSAGTSGLDVSWPNCKSVVSGSSFGIVGVSDGTGYSANPCLAQESSHFANNLSFYVNTGWNNKSSYINPSSPKKCAATDDNCLAYNYGYNAGLYAYNAATIAGVHGATWWLDVESSNTWNKNTLQNQNSLSGERDALMASAGISTVGIYSTTSQWDSITGKWLNNWPSWGATTWTTAGQAKTYCSGHQFTNGPSYIMQFIAKKSPLDQDVAC